MFQVGDLLLGKQPEELKLNGSEGDLGIQKEVAGRVWEVTGSGRLKDLVTIKNHATGEAAILGSTGYHPYRFTKI